MKKKSLFVAAAALCISTTAFAQSDGTLGVYSDVDASSCCLSVAQFAMGTAHVLVTLSGASAGGGGIPAGITGAEFRLEIPSPQNYFLTWNVNPASNVQLGNPIDTTPMDPNDTHGITMGFPGCQGMMVGDKVSLGTITIFNAGGAPTPIRVKRKQPPSNPTLRDCPLLVLCDIGTFTQICLSPQASGEPEEPIHFAAQLNVVGCGATTCGPVAVEPVNWTAVKSLFR